MPNYKFYLKYEPATESDVVDYAANPTNFFTNGSDHILYDGEWHRFYPGVNRDCNIDYDIWDHKHRRKFNGELTLFNNLTQTDYTYLSQIVKTSMEIKLRVELNCGTTSASDWWEGYFGIVDGEWDIDRGLFVVEPSPDDSYRLLEGYGDKIFNIYDLNPSVSVGIDFSDITGSVYSDCTDLDEGQWKQYHLPSGVYTFPYPTTEEDWDGYTYVSATPCFGTYVIHEWSYLSTQSFDFGNGRGILLKDVIDHIVSNNAGLAYVSTFLENDEFPTDHADIPIGTKNYVTTTDPNPLNGMVWMQLSNIKPTSDPATKWSLTFNELMEMLKVMFNVDWFVDDDGKFRIEHWSYFENTTASDTDLTALDGGKWAYHKNKYSYDIENMPSQEHYEFQQADGVDFIGKDIIYNPLSTFNRYKSNIREYTIPVTTDAKFMHNNDVDIEGEGWVLLTVGSDMVILNEIGLITGETYPNAHLSWANLHYNYHRHGRIIDRGNMNGSDIVFESYRRNIKQTEITYPVCCGDFDPMAYKVTGLGVGEVRAAQYRLIDGTVKSVFFYHDVKASSFPIPETYYIKINGNDVLLYDDLNKLVYYG